MTSRLEHEINAAFRKFIGDGSYPCLAARGLARRHDYDLHVYDCLGHPASSAALAADLAMFTRAASARRTSDPFVAFVAVFDGPAPVSERAFERRLWAELQGLHDGDDPAAGWDPAVSPDPDDPQFSFSFAGSALFVIGLHPNSSRVARRFPWPTLVFNPHAQFERLRRAGRFTTLRDRIRARDFALQGSVNPNVADFGVRSEAGQYSGRDTTGEAWRCPFHPRKR
jgi:FPC/CPF motif-containing protein YcgG